MASLPSPPLFELEISKTRQRRQTESLLPASFDPKSDEIPSVPIPETDKKAYTMERFQKSLEYCQRFLARRDISPRSETFMMVFKEELKIAMLAENEDDKLTSVGSVRAFESLIQKSAFLNAAVFTKTQEMHQNLLELRELQYYSRYGDYVKIVPARLRTHVSEKKTEGWQLLCGRYHWSEISQRLSREDQNNGPQRSQAADPLDLQTYVAVQRACRNLGISEDLAIWSIIQYGARNRAFDRDIDGLIAEGDYYRLSQVLYNDLEDVDCVFSEVRSATDRHALKLTIWDEMDKWFDRSIDTDDINTWISKPELIAAYLAAKAAKDKPTKAETKAANNAENERRCREKAARLLALASNRSTSASKKRTASTEVPRGSEDETAERNAERQRKLRLQLTKLEEQLERVRVEIGNHDNP